MIKLYLNTIEQGDRLDILSRFEELLKLKKSETMLVELQQLLALSKQEQDRPLTMKIFMYIVETYRYIRKHDEAIALLEKAVTDEYFTDKDEHLKILDELIRILLRTENFMKLKSVLYTRERFLTNEHQKVMQKFYYAVCHEGLKENKIAIDYLMSIKDNISNSNLVSKYLKLSMLNLKEHQLNKAKDYYGAAVKFDHKKKNPIFYLAESDILYYEGDFINALATYQEYFIKSKNKNRYLDRYILINIKLNHLDEAWRFYLEYLPTMNNLISINYRVVFYEAAIVLAKELGNTLEVEKLHDLIQEIEPKAPVLNQFDHVYRLLSLSFADKKYAKERDILFDLFKALDSLYKFQKLLFIKKVDDNIQFYHYSKGLLLEKSPKITEYSNTIIEDILTSEPVNNLYTYDDIIGYSKSMYKTVETAYVFANGIKREDSFNYFVVYTSEREQFDFQQKLVLLAHQIIRKELNDYDFHKNQYRVYHNYLNLFNQEKIGFIKIEKEIIHLLNDHAKTVLGIDMDYIHFEEFQSLLEKKVFIDEFLYTDQLTVRLKLNQGSKPVIFSISKDEFTIYATVKDMESKGEKKYLNQFVNSPNEIQMVEDLQASSGKTVLLFHITNYLKFFKDYNYNRYQDLLHKFMSELKALSKHHFNELYLESFHLQYLVINSIDKRVITRIIDSILKTFDEFVLRVSITQLTQGFQYEQLIKLRYLNSLTTKDNPYIFDNKNFRYNVELAKTILINVNSLIQSKIVPLEYQVVANWQTNKIEYLKVDVSSNAMLGEKNSLIRVLKANDLETEWNTVVVNSLVKELKKTNYLGRVMIDVSYKTLSDIKGLKKLVKKLQSYYSSLEYIVLLIDIDDITKLSDVIDNIQYLKEQHIDLCGQNFLHKLHLEHIELFQHMKQLILNKSDLNQPNLKKFLQIFADFNIEYICNHGKESITKTILNDFDIQCIYGDKYPKYDTVSALINHK